MLENKCVCVCVCRGRGEWLVRAYMSACSVNYLTQFRFQYQWQRDARIGDSGMKVTVQLENLSALGPITNGNWPFLSLIHDSKFMSQASVLCGFRIPFQLVYEGV